MGAILFSVTVFSGRGNMQIEGLFFGALLHANSPCGAALYARQSPGRCCSGVCGVGGRAGSPPYSINCRTAAAKGACGAIGAGCGTRISPL